MKTTTDRTYNGYANRATWNTQLWLGNTEAWYFDLNQKILTLIEAHFIQYRIGCGDYSTPELLKYWNEPAADMIEEYCRSQWGNETPDDADLNEVNWSELAGHWLEDGFDTFKELKREGCYK